MPSTFPEDLDKEPFKNHPENYVIENARLKALDVYESLKKQSTVPDLIIGCDTVAEFEGVIIERPKDKDHAVQILERSFADSAPFSFPFLPFSFFRLNGKEHFVYSGLALLTPNASKSSGREDWNIECGGIYRSHSNHESLSLQNPT